MAFKSNKPVASKLSADDFILKAIRTLRAPESEWGKKLVTKTGNSYVVSKGIHTVITGFNAAFRQYFGADADPVAATKDAAARGVIVVGGARGGAMLYLPGEAPERDDSQRVAKTLSAMGL